MKKKIFLHIGLSKSGSTLLQKMIFPFFDDIVYFNSRNSNSLSYEKIFLLIDDNTKGALFSGEWYSGNLRDFHFQTPEFVNTRFRSSIEQSIDEAIEKYPEAEIIVFFRKHDDYILSAYKHYLKYRGTLSFDE